MLAQMDYISSSLFRVGLENAPGDDLWSVIYPETNSDLPQLRIMCLKTRSEVLPRKSIKLAKFWVIPF